ncbi:hypothetical protein IEQ34_013846 [Dendrobium chrysotoxum]|uniref:Uncharacterized protein n=1 Tax=Dendrobium chrysotoxum TaxID=161865 RepID=A0AAV7GPL6_DENCH|nr:hypothetical protein IEQ34_013846 [Dendrobium chrysotoxum]
MGTGEQSRRRRETNIHLVEKNRGQINGVVGGVADVFGVQEAEVLAREGIRKGTGVGDGEGEAMAAELGIFRDDGEGEGGREGEEGAVSGVLETDGDAVECVADETASIVSEPEDTVVIDLGDATEGYVAVTVAVARVEAGEFELFALGEC